MRPKLVTSRELMTAIASAGGMARPADLLHMLAISQPTLSRLVRDAGAAVIAIGRGKATRYALLRNVRGKGSGFPVYRVDTAGKVARHGELFALQGDHSLLRYVDGGEGLHASLPWIIDDMRPQGFLGRIFAQQAAALGVLSVPADPREWQGDDVLLALATRGEDCVGNLLLGDEALARYLERAAQPTAVERCDYPALALATLAGELPGSSAGGEQPKFTCAALGADGVARHLIVKFSPPVDSGAAARRWADLLVCEHLALETLREAGWLAAPSTLIEAGNRVMLEVERFDRTSAGRIGIVSGAALEAEFVGGATTWSKLGDALAAQGRLAPEDAEHLVALEIFGGMIGNSDMHLGNISFFTDTRFSLTPCYDMLPMRYAPAGRGEILPETATPGMPTFSWENRQAWRVAAQLAEQFWRAVQCETRLGGRLEAIATTSLNALKEASARCELLR